MPPNSSTVSRKCPAGPIGRVDLEAVPHAGVEVVGAVTGRRVDGAGAGVERDVVGEHAERIALVERMPETDALRAASPFIRATGTPNVAPDGRRDLRREALRDDHRASVDVVRGVVELRMERDRQVRRNRPRRRRPDQHRDLRPASAGTRDAESPALSGASGNST